MTASDNTPHAHVARRTGAPRVVVWSPVRSGEVLDLSDDVASFATSKAITAPGGTFQLTVLPRTAARGAAATLRDRERAWSALEPGALVSIGFDEPGGIMLGIVERIEHARVKAGDVVRKALIIRGGDFGTLLSRDQVQHAMITVEGFQSFYDAVQAALGPAHPLAAPMRGVWGPPRTDEVRQDTLHAFTGANLQTVVDWILREVTSFRIPAFAAFGKATASDFMATRVTDGFVRTFWSETPNQFSGSVFGFLRSLIDADFYELWVDTVPTGDALARPVLIVRPKPFDDPRLDFARTTADNGVTWSTLRTMITDEPHHAIPESEILEETLGRGSDEVSSMYLVRSVNALIGNPANEEEGLYFPTVDTWSVSRFGMRPYRADLSLIANDLFRKSDDPTYTGAVYAEVLEARNRLVNWYRLAPFFETGQIRVWGRDRYRVGDKVYLEHVTAFRTSSAWISGRSTATADESEGLEFYVSGVSHSWSFGGHYTTTLRLERGYNSAVVDVAKAQIRSDAPTSNPSHLAET